MKIFAPNRFYTSGIIIPIVLILLSSCDSNSNTNNKTPKKGSSQNKTIHKKHKSEEDKRLEAEEVVFRGKLKDLKSFSKSKDFKNQILKAHSRWYQLHPDKPWDLRGLDFSGANFEGLIDIFIDADLSSSIFNNTNLSSCNLSGSNVAHSLFINTNFGCAKLNNLKNASSANFQGAITTPITEIDATTLAIIKDQINSLSFDEYLEHQIISHANSLIKAFEEKNPLVIQNAEDIIPNIKKIQIGINNIEFYFLNIPRLRKDHQEIAKYFEENPKGDIAYCQTSNSQKLIAIYDTLNILNRVITSPFIRAHMQAPLSSTDKEKSEFIYVLHSTLNTLKIRIQEYKGNNDKSDIQEYFEINKNK